MPPVLTRNGDTLEVTLSGCRGFEFQDAKEQIKEVPGRRWDPDRKVWTVPGSVHNAERLLKTISPEVGEDVMDWIRESRSHAEESLTQPLPGDSPRRLLIPWGYERCAWQPEVVNDEKFTGALPYQRAAIDVVARRKRAILADDMGLGKTFEGLSSVEEYILRNVREDGVTRPSGPRLVVAPNSVVGGWAREINRWLPDPAVEIIDAKTPANRHKQLLAALAVEECWVVVNWEQLRVRKLKVKMSNGSDKTLKVMKEPLFQYPFAAGDALSLDDMLDPVYLAKLDRTYKQRLKDGEGSGWLAALADEAHRAKNRLAQQTQGLWRVQADVMAALTGTPIMNSPDELWSLLRWLWPNEFHERGSNFSEGAVAYWAFYEDYVDYYEDARNRRVVTGVKNPDALRYVLSGKLIRRTSQILGLKGRKRIYYPLGLTKHQQGLYDDAVMDMWLRVTAEAEQGDPDAAEFAAKLEEGADLATLVRIPNGAARFVRQQQIIENTALLGGPDESAGMDDFEEKYEDSRPEPWVVFCNYKESCEILAARLRRRGANVATYHGDVPPSERTKIEDSFQRGEIDVVIGTIKGMKEGITLTRGHLQFWLSRDVVPDINDQGESRCDRLGQQRQVLVYIPQASGTVAVNKVAPLNKTKMRIVKTVVPKTPIEEVHH